MTAGRADEQPTTSDDETDPVAVMLDRLTREGQLVAAMAATHQSFHRYHEECLRLAASATTDPGALDELQRTIDAYTTLFHDHHSAEETYLFPTLRRLDPRFDAVVDELLVQHDRLAGLVGSVVAAASALGHAGDVGAADGVALLVAHLVELDRLIAAHLDLEEAQTVPEMTTWTTWPSAPPPPTAPA
jgi:hemerythrin-like domain-containing protein